MWKIIIGILLIVPTLGANELKLGILYHDIAPVWGNTKIERGVDLNAEFIFTGWVVRPCAGVSINSCGHTSRVYCGGVIPLRATNIVCSVSCGFAVQVNSERKLGSHVLFRVAGEIGYQFGPHSVSIILDHISNANLAEHNAGLDLLGIRYGWRW